MFKFKQVVVTYIRTLPSPPSQLPFELGHVPHSGRHKHSRGEAGPALTTASDAPRSRAPRGALLLVAAQSDKGVAVRCVDPGDGTPQPCCKVVTGKQEGGSISRHGYGCEFHLPFGVCVSRCVCPYVCPSIWFSVCSWICSLALYSRFRHTSRFTLLATYMDSSQTTTRT